MKVIEKIQYIEQDILDYVVEFCEKNNIEYWLDWGTLLGCIRHQGFIPWDDDIDISMLYEDYIRFKELFRKEKGIYKMIDESVEGYDNHFIKIINKKHFCKEKGRRKKVNIWIDIFPIERYKKNDLPKIQKLEKCKEKINKYKVNRTIIKNIYLKFLRLQRAKYIKILEKIQKDNYGEILVHNLRESKVYYYLETDIFPLRKGMFGTRKYNIPNKAETYLQIEYGDFTVLPSFDKRQGHIEVDKIEFDEEDLERIIKKYHK